MTLAELLAQAAEEVLHDAAQALDRAHLPHYEATARSETREALDDLYAHVVECAAGRTLVPVVQYGARVAEHRFEAGFEIAEVQVGFNVLEEAVWRVVVPRLAPDDLASATATIGAVFGAGKDALTRAWVALLAPADRVAVEDQRSA